MAWFNLSEDELHYWEQHHEKYIEQNKINATLLLDGCLNDIYNYLGVLRNEFTAEMLNYIGIEVKELDEDMLRFVCANTGHNFNPKAVGYYFYKSINGKSIPYLFLSQPLLDRPNKKIYCIFDDFGNNLKIKFNALSIDFIDPTDSKFEIKRK